MAWMWAWSGQTADRERLPIKISRSRHNSTLNTSETAKDTAVVTIECRQETVLKPSNATILNDFE